MEQIPVWHSQPTFTDMHSQKYFASDADAEAFAASYYSKVWEFLLHVPISGNAIVFGETNPVACDGYTPSGAAAMLAGYKASSLYKNASRQVIMRPWHRTETGSACVTSPHTINPPFNPFEP